MVASHNEDTVRFTLQQMQKNNIKPEDKVLVKTNITFQKIDIYSSGYLLWAASGNVRQSFIPTWYAYTDPSNHIQFENTGQAGFSVYKYVPYGPVNEVLPYLSRYPGFLQLFSN